jgi:hypothetical protein
LIQTDLQVKELGVFDDNQDGLNANLRVAIFDQDVWETTRSIEKAMVTPLVIFQKDREYPLRAGHRFAPLQQPVVLPAGFRGVVAASGYCSPDLCPDSLGPHGETVYAEAERPFMNCARPSNWYHNGFASVQQLPDHCYSQDQGNQIEGAVRAKGTQVPVLKTDTGGDNAITVSGVAWYDYRIGKTEDGEETPAPTPYVAPMNYPDNGDTSDFDDGDDFFDNEGPSFPFRRRLADKYDDTSHTTFNSLTDQHTLAYPNTAMSALVQGNSATSPVLIAAGSFRYTSDLGTLSGGCSCSLHAPINVHVHFDPLLAAEAMSTTQTPCAVADGADSFYGNFEGEMGCPSLEFNPFVAVWDRMLSRRQLEKYLRVDVDANDQSAHAVEVVPPAVLLAEATADGAMAYTAGGIGDAGLMVERLRFMDSFVMVNRSVWTTQVMLPHTGARVNLFSRGWDATLSTQYGGSASIGTEAISWQVSKGGYGEGEANGDAWSAIKTTDTFASFGSSATSSSSSCVVGSSDDCGNIGDCAWDCSAVNYLNSSVTDFTLQLGGSARAQAHESMVAKPVCTGDEYNAADAFMRSRLSPDYLGRSEYRHPIGNGECGAGTTLPDSMPLPFEDAVAVFTATLPQVKSGHTTIQAASQEQRSLMQTYTKTGWGLSRGSKCFPAMLGDGVCDPACYSAECDFDLGDCRIKDGAVEVYDIVSIRKHSGNNGDNSTTTASTDDRSTTLLSASGGHSNSSALLSTESALLAKARLKASVLAPFVSSMGHDELKAYLLERGKEREAAAAAAVSSDAAKDASSSATTTDSSTSAHLRRSLLEYGRGAVEYAWSLPEYLHQRVVARSDPHRQLNIRRSGGAANSYSFWSADVNSELSVEDEKVADDYWKGAGSDAFSNTPALARAIVDMYQLQLQPGYNTINPLVDKAAPRYRTVGLSNTLVGGVLFSLRRLKSTDCGEGRFERLQKQCVAKNGTFETQPYGADPVFMSTSQLYDDSLNQKDYYDPTNFADVSSVTGMPFGFTSHEGVYHVYLDASMDENKINKVVKMMEEGFYIDKQASELKVRVLIFNGDEKVFGFASFGFIFRRTGPLSINPEFTTFRLPNYSGSMGRTRLVLELLVLICVVINLLAEVLSIGKSGFFAYFSDGWNYADLGNLILMIILFASWWHFYQSMSISFAPEPRYYVYDDVKANARYLKLNYSDAAPGEPEEFFRMLKMFEDVETVASYYTSYAGTTTVSLMIMMLRLIKMLDFQPRMGLVTRTVSAALNDLGHFFGLFTLVFVGLASIAYLNFGRSLEKFSSIGWSIDTCFRLMLGDTEPYEAMLTTSSSTSAILFYYCFMVIVFFVLLNILLAILVDAYADVKAKTEEESAQTMPTELMDIIEDTIRQPNRSRLGQPTDAKMLKLLEHITDGFAAANTENKTAVRRVLRWKQDTLGFPTLVDTLVREGGLSQEQAVSLGDILLERYGEDQEVVVPGKHEGDEQQEQQQQQEEEEEEEEEEDRRRGSFSFMRRISLPGAQSRQPHEDRADEEEEKEGGRRGSFSFMRRRVSLPGGGKGGLRGKPADAISLDSLDARLTQLPPSIPNQQQQQLIEVAASPAILSEVLEQALGAMPLRRGSSAQRAQAEMAEADV